MSFTGTIKEEVCNLKTTKTDEISELSALVRNLATIYDQYFHSHDQCDKHYQFL